MTHYSKNFVTDYSAPTNGVSDCNSAAVAFTTFLSGLSAGDVVDLSFPAHTYQFTTSSNLCVGILGGITVNMNLASGTVLTGNINLGPQVAIADDSTHSSRVLAISPSATSVFLATPSEYTRFSVLQWIAVTGIDLQGFGSPPNPAFFEFRQITAINSGTGEISLTAPLTQSYLTTWPNYGQTSPDLGGPATIYAMNAQWDLDVTYNGTGCTFTNNSNIIFCKARRYTINGGTVTSGSGIGPTANQYAAHIGVNQSACDLEPDKMIDTLIYTGGSVNSFDFQSMGSATNFTATNVAVALYNGTPRNTVISGGTAGEIRVGPHSYGSADSVDISICVVSAISTNPASVRNLVGSGYTMSDGTLRLPKATGVPAWAVPGAVCYWAGAKDNEGNSFRILTVTDDGTNTVIKTTATGGFPSVPLQGGTNIDLYVHPCPVWSGTGNTGCSDIIDLSQAGAQGKPIYSYSKRTYTASTLGSQSPNIWGRISTIVVNVSPAFTTSGTLTCKLFGQFQANAIDPDNSSSSWSPSVNLKISGTRTYTRGAGWSGTQSGDSLSDPGDIWFAGAQAPYASGAVTGGDLGVISIEVTTDQGFRHAYCPLHFHA